MSKKMTRSEAGRLGAEKTKQIWLQRYAKQPNHCVFCKEVLPYSKRHNKFCNQSCAASFNNKGVCRNSKKPFNECLNCQKSTKNKTFCSLRCHHEHFWKKKKKEIESSGEAPYVGTAKRYLRETRGCKCEICNRKKWCGESIPLVMDHIDGNSENNKLENLRLVCGNCDMQLPTYKSKNRGNGRHKRRQRYREGKSY